jgi:hypothetical protein
MPLGIHNNVGEVAKSSEKLHRVDWWVGIHASEECINPKDCITIYYVVCNRSETT